MRIDSFQPLGSVWGGIYIAVDDYDSCFQRTIMRLGTLVFEDAVLFWVMPKYSMPLYNSCCIVC